MPALSERIRRIPPSATIAMTMRAREMRGAGAEVISLSIGQPDFPTPPHAIEAAHAAALRGETKYPPVDGLPELKRAIQRKFQRENDLDYALDEITVSNGGKQIIYNAFMATLDPGDEVIVAAPYWGAYELIAQLAGGVTVVVDCPESTGFRLRAADLAAAITPRTKWLVINFPNNPTGACADREDIAALAEILLRHPQVWIMSDDIYEHLLYDGFQHATIAAVEPRLKDRVLTVNGVSKTYAMTGWRVGYAGGPRILIKAMVNMQGHATSGVAGVCQAAAAAALDGPQDFVVDRAAIYRARRNLVLDGLRDAPGMTCHRPEGAFYLYPNIAGCLGRISAGGRRIDTDQDFALALLEEQHVAVVQGGAFGMSPYVRISYAVDEAVLVEACRRIVQFCNGLQ
jgi:aspartate aminotransferase